MLPTSRETEGIDVAFLLREKEADAREGIDSILSSARKDSK